MQKNFKCFNVNFRLLKTIYVHLLVCYLNKLRDNICVPERERKRQTDRQTEKAG